MSLFKVEVSMEKIKYLVLIFLVELTYACPGCAGSMNNPKDGRLVWILCAFILFTYIPFYILYRTIVKNRHLSGNVPTVTNEENSSAIE